MGMVVGSNNQSAPPPPRRKRVALKPVTVTESVGKTWARYHIVSQLGRGGMTIVYKTYQPGLDRHVAIKFLLPQATPDQTLIKRFKQEANRASAVQRRTLTRRSRVTIQLPMRLPR